MKKKYEKAWHLPKDDKLPNESNWDYCLRLARNHPPANLVRNLLIYIHENRKRGDKQPLWSKVGEATAHGSGVSSAIVATYLPELEDD